MVTAAGRGGGAGRGECSAAAATRGSTRPRLVQKKKKKIETNFEGRKSKNTQQLV
jgi:hypothetical protein